MRDLPFDSRLEAVVHSILLVEDDPQTAAEVKLYLERQGFNVVVAKDGGQAQSSFVMRKPDFVILDVILPGESGFEVCERLKVTDPRVPVMLLTAIDMEDSRALARRIGADVYVTKPFNPGTFVDTILEAAETVWRKYREEATTKELPVRFACPCGKRFKVNPTHRGKALTCPSCGESVLVPRHA